jgi:hypothetical protein
MSTHPTPAEIQAHYRANVEALSTPDLLRMVRGDFAPGTPAYIRKPLTGLASLIAQDRGVTLPLFSALTMGV